MITRLRIQGFKCFRDLELDPLKRITILGGRNNVGKTAVLEAVFLFFDRLNPNMTVRQFAARGVPTLPLTPEGVFLPIFRGYNAAEALSIEAEVGGRREVMRVTYNDRFVAAEVRGRPKPLPGMPATIRTDEMATPYVALDISVDSDSAAADTSHLVLHETGVVLHVDKATGPIHPAAIVAGPGAPNDLATRFGQLDVEGMRPEVVRFLQMIEPGLEDLSTITAGDVSLIYGSVVGQRKIPVAYMGDGMSRLLNMIVYLATTRNGILLVDEIENGIHYSAMLGVWQALAEAAKHFNCQILATTHSRECLEAAREGLGDEYADDLAYIRLHRTGEEIAPKYYDYELLGTAEKTGLEVR